MNYIYDILLNWNSVLYDFYEWDNHDEIIHIRKIPIFKISSEQLLELETSKICIKKEILNKIYRKSEIFTNKNIKELDYVSLFSDGESILGIEFNKFGESKKKSRLLIDEEEEVLEVVLRMPENKIQYEIKKKEPYLFQTRKEVEQNNYLKRQLSCLKKETPSKKLNCLYYECYNEKGKERESMLNRLERSLEDKDEKILKRMEDFFKLISLHK